MKLVLDKNLVANNYEVTVKVTEITEEETELLKDFGDLTINIGGKITETVQKVVTGTDSEGNSTSTTVDEVVEIANLGDIYKKFPTDFPLTKTFTKANFGEKSDKVAIAYVSKVTKEIQDAVTALKAKQDVFSGTTEIIL